MSVEQDAPTPSIVIGSDERAREVAIREAAQALAPFSGDPADSPTRLALVILNAAIHPQHERCAHVLARLGAASAALAASKPTDAGARFVVVPRDALDHVVGMLHNAGFHSTAECFAALATPKPLVDEAMREALEQIAGDKTELQQPGDYARGWNDARFRMKQIASAAIRNLTGDGAGA